MVELIPLPYRGYGTANSMDLRLRILSLENIIMYGRMIYLFPFLTDSIRKYKLVEYLGDRIVERIFFASKKIQQDEVWWKDNWSIYPISCKTITGENSLNGKSFKYAQGILHYLQDYQSSDIHAPAFGSEANGLGNYIIPSPEENLIAHDYHELYSFHGPYDRWIQDDVDLSELYPNLRWTDISEKGLISLAQTDANDSIIHGSICVDIDPIDLSWSMWELINKLNEIAATDVTITVLKDGVSVQFDSRYNLMYSSDIQYNMLVSLLSQLATNMVVERFSNLSWVKIVISKRWSEEVYIDVYESINPLVVSQVLYIDLPIFSLGTVGIQSDVISIPTSASLT